MREESIFFQHDVFELHLHGRAGVKLQGENAFFGTFGSFVSYVHGFVAVDEVLQMSSFDDDAVFIPIFLFDRGLDFIAFADFTEDFDFGLGGFFAGGDFHLLTTECEDAATFFLVKDAAVFRAEFAVSLVAADDEFGGIDELAAILHTAIARAGELVLEGQFKVSHFSVFPDEEGIARGGFFFGGAASDGAVFDRPKIRIALPAREVFAIEELLFSGKGKGAGKKCQGGVGDEFHRMIIFGESCQIIIGKALVKGR